MIFDFIIFLAVSLRAKLTFHKIRRKLQMTSKREFE